MNVILFGATGMVGQGVLRECLLDPNVERVLSLGRTSGGVSNAKLQEIIRKELWNYADIETSLSGFDACCFCLGIASSGMTEEDYERVTYGIALAAAKVLCQLSPQMKFIFVSGAGADSSERGRLMWARIKGKTENAILRLPFAAAYVFRPGVIQPMHGEKSKTTLYRVFASIAKPLLPLLRTVFPNYVLTTEEIGRAMLTVVRHGAAKRILESADVRAVLVPRT